MGICRESRATLCDRGRSPRATEVVDVVLGLAEEASSAASCVSECPGIGDLFVRDQTWARRRWTRARCRVPRRPFQASQRLCLSRPYAYSPQRCCRRKRIRAWRFPSNRPASFARHPCTRIWRNLLRWRPPVPDFPIAKLLFLSLPQLLCACPCARRLPPAFAAREKTLRQCREPSATARPLDRPGGPGIAANPGSY